jgi:hypothetical protein
MNLLVSAVLSAFWNVIYFIINEGLKSVFGIEQWDIVLSNVVLASLSMWTWHVYQKQHSMLKYAINRPISTLGLKPSGPYRSLGMITVQIWKTAVMHWSIYRKAWYRVISFSPRYLPMDWYRCGTSGVYVWAKLTLLLINMW